MKKYRPNAGFQSMKREVPILKRTGPVRPPLPRTVNPLFRLAHHGHVFHNLKTIAC